MDIEVSNEVLSGISAFQRRYRKYKLIQFITNNFFKRVFNDIMKHTFVQKVGHPCDENYLEILSISFNKLGNHIRRKPLIKVINKFLDKLYNYMNTQFKEYDINNIIAPRLFARDLLSAFCIAGFPEFILDMNVSDINKLEDCVKKDIYMLAKKMVISWGLLVNDNKEESLRKFIKSLNMYSNCYMVFMNQDKKDKIQDLVIRWYYLEKAIIDIKHSNYPDYKKQESFEFYYKNQDTTVDMIRKINRNFDETYLFWFKSVADKLEENMNKSFWDILSQDIKDNNFDMFSKLLEEIKMEIFGLNNGNEQIRLELEKYLDVGFIKQMATHNAYDINQILGLADYLLSKLKDLQAPVRTEPMVKEWGDLVTDIKTMNDLDKQIINILRFILDEIQTIKLDIVTIYALNVKN